MKQLLLSIPLWVSTSVYAENADSARYYFNRGLDEKSSKHYLVASQLFDKAIKFQPTFTEAILEQGFTYLEMRKTDPAKACFTKVYELEPSNKSAIRELMTLYFNYRQFAKAIELAKKCPECELSLRITGMSHYQLENYPEAEKSLLAALKKEPLDAEAAYTLGRTYLEMEEYKKAIPFYEKAVNSTDAKNTWIYELALLYYNQFDYKNAMRGFNMAAEHGYAMSNDFKENMGFAALYNGEFEKGESLIMEVWTKKPGDRDLLRVMSEVLYKQKQYDQSLLYCQKLLELDEKDGKALYQAGLNFQRKGQKDKGMQMCDKAIELDPSLDALRRKKEMSRL